MADMEVPENVARAVLARWPARGSAWLEAAAADILALCERHSVVPVYVFPARFALVVATSAAGRSLVMRSTADPRGEQQATAARMLAELDIGPQVYEVITSSVGTCIVMDEVQPGTVAHNCVAADIAGLLRPLVRAPATTRELPSISGWIRQRLLRGDMRPDVYPGATAPTESEREHALALLDDLSEDEATSICHGDASTPNILRGHDRLYLIDPRGVIGDIEYDVAVAAVKNGLDVRELAFTLEIDHSRAEAWAAIALAARV